MTTGSLVLNFAQSVSNVTHLCFGQGEEGVKEVLQILNEEFRLSMALSGTS